MAQSVNDIGRGVGVATHRADRARRQAFLGAGGRHRNDVLHLVARGDRLLRHLPAHAAVAVNTVGQAVAIAGGRGARAGLQRALRVGHRAETLSLLIEALGAVVVHKGLLTAHTTVRVPVVLYPDVLTVLALDAFIIVIAAARRESERKHEEQKERKEKRDPCRSFHTLIAFPIRARSCFGGITYPPCGSDLYVLPPLYH